MRKGKFESNSEVGYGMRRLSWREGGVKRKKNTFVEIKTKHDSDFEHEMLLFPFVNSTSVADVHHCHHFLCVRFYL